MLNNSACLYIRGLTVQQYTRIALHQSKGICTVATTSYCTTTVPYTVRLPDSVDLPTPALTSAGAGMWRPEGWLALWKIKGF